MGAGRRAAGRSGEGEEVEEEVEEWFEDYWREKSVFGGCESSVL